MEEEDINMGNMREIGNNIAEYSKKNTTKLIFRAVLAGAIVGGGYEIVGRQGRDIESAIEQIKKVIYEIGKDCRIETPDGKTIQNPKCKGTVSPPRPWGM